METILCRLPNYLGDTCMCLPALQLLAASGYTPSLVGRSWAGDLLAGLGWRFDPIEGKLFNDISRVRRYPPRHSLSEFSEFRVAFPDGLK